VIGADATARGPRITRRAFTLSVAAAGLLGARGAGAAARPRAGAVRSSRLTKQLDHAFTVVGHRGEPRGAPENTLPSIARAFALGAGMVEIDVQRSRDGVPVVFHDEDTLARTSTGRGRVGDLTLAELKRLDAGSWMAPRFAGVRIPTLAEALAAARGRGRVLLDLKEAGMGAAIAAIARRAGVAPAMLVVGTWTPEQEADALRHLRGAQVLKTDGLPAEHGPAYLDAQRARGLAGFEMGDAWSAAFVDAAHAHGLVVYAYTVNDESAMRRLIAMGIDAIETDELALLLRVVREITAGR
jgi:glycerophosphoryl diester phosphodiesterase